MQRRYVVVAMAASIAGLAAAPARAQLDMGDAPSGGPAGYLTATPVAGSFPVSSGPRHMGAGALRIGPAWARDDGASLRSLKPCATSLLYVLIDARRLPRAQRTGDAVVNAWFDFDRDGSWDDAGCAVEWAVQNLHVPMTRLGADGTILLPIEFTAGAQLQEFWWRVTVTHNQDLSSHAAAAPAVLAAGETEDRLSRRPVRAGRLGARHAALRPRTRPARRAKGRRSQAVGAQRKADFTVACDPDPLQIAHGRKGRITFRVFDGNPTAGSIDGDYSRNMVFSSRYRTTLIKSPNQKGAPRGKRFVIAVDVESRKEHRTNAANVTERFSVDFFFTRRGSGSQTLRCPVQVQHELVPKPEKPKKPDPPPSPPPPPAGAAPPAPAAKVLRPEGAPIKISGTPGATDVAPRRALASGERTFAVGTQRIGGVQRLFIEQAGGSECGGDGVFEGHALAAGGELAVSSTQAHIYVMSRAQGESQSDLRRFSSLTCEPDPGFGARPLSGDPVALSGVDAGKICAGGFMTIPGNKRVPAYQCISEDGQPAGDGTAGPEAPGILTDVAMASGGRVLGYGNGPPSGTGNGDVIAGASANGSGPFGSFGYFGDGDPQIAGPFSPLASAIVYAALTYDAISFALKSTSLFALNLDGSVRVPFMSWNPMGMSRSYPVALLAMAAAGHFTLLGSGDVAPERARLFIALMVLGNGGISVLDEYFFDPASPEGEIALDASFPFGAALGALLFQQAFEDAFYMYRLREQVLR